MMEIGAKNPFMKRIYCGKVIIYFSLVVAQPAFGESVIDTYIHEGTSIVSLLFIYLLSFYGNSIFLNFLLPFYVLLRNHLQGRAVFPRTSLAMQTKEVVFVLICISANCKVLYHEDFRASWCEK